MVTRDFLSTCRVATAVAAGLRFTWYQIFAIRRLVMHGHTFFIRRVNVSHVRCVRRVLPCRIAWCFRQVVTRDFLSTRRVLTTVNARGMFIVS